MSAAAREYAPKAIFRLFVTVDDAMPAAGNSGIIGNKAHTSGYHRSRLRLIALGRPGDYSIRAPIDQQGDGDAAAALDIGGPQDVLQVLCRRAVDATESRDPRWVGKVREFGGSLDGRTVTARRVIDNEPISFDSSHRTHFHLSIHRAFVNDDEACQGIAQVLAGIPLDATPWDGHSFPGGWRFNAGQVGPWVTLLGERLVAHGFGRFYSVGPGPEWSTSDESAVRAFQLAQGWRGDDANGIPGPITWRLLMAPPQPPQPDPTPQPPAWDGAFPGADKFGPGQSGPWIIRLRQRLDTHGAPGDLGAGDRWDGDLQAAVRWFQERQGWRGPDADGIPGPETWRRLTNDPTPTEPAVTVRYVFANVLRRTDPARTRKRWPERRRDVIRHILSADPDLVVCCEVDMATADDIAAGLGSGWSYSRDHGLAAFWRQAKLVRTAEARELLYPDRDNRRLLSVPLADRKSGRALWADVTHLENDGDPATDGHRARHIEAAFAAEHTKTGRRILGWDCNSTTLADEHATARQAEKPRPTLARIAGWRFATSQHWKWGGQYESHHGGLARGLVPGRKIDDIAVRGGAEIDDVWLIPTHETDASDHHFIGATIRI